MYATDACANIEMMTASYARLACAQCIKQKNRKKSEKGKKTRQFFAQRSTLLQYTAIFYCRPELWTVHSAKHIMLPRVHYIRGFQIDDCVFQRVPNFANLRDQVYYPVPN